MARRAWLTSGAYTDNIQTNVNKFYAAVAEVGGSVIDAAITTGQQGNDGGWIVVVMVTYDADQEVTIELEKKKGRGIRGVPMGSVSG